MLGGTVDGTVDGTVGGQATGPLWADRGDPVLLATPDDEDADPSRDVDVLVVGLGATGLTAVVELATAGARVLGVDARTIGAGAAGANGGFLLAGLSRFHHDAVARYGRETAARWYARTTDELERTFAEEPTATRTGILRSAVDDAELVDLRAQRDALHRDGYAATEVDGPLGPALLVPGDGAFDPMARCRRLARSAVDRGARLLGGVRVVVDGGAAVVAGRRWRPRGVLVAVDGGLEDAVPALRGEVTSIRLQMLATTPQEQRVLDRPVYHRWGYDYAQQLADGALAVGGGRDLEDDAARGGEAHPTAVVQDHLDRLAGRLGATGPVTHRWAARSAYTADGLPVDRRLAPGVHVVGALNGHGNVLGPLLAREAATRLLDDLAA